MKNKNGSVLLGVLLLLTGLLSVGIALTSTVTSSSIKIQKQYQKLSALAYAEAGVNKGLWKINNDDLSYGTGAEGTLESDLSGGEYRVFITPCTGGSTDCKYIESTGYVPNHTSPQAQKTVRVKINSVSNATNLVFNYSAQSNANQISMSNGAEIKGSAYSAGPIYMSNNSKVSGNATSVGASPDKSYITGGRVTGNANAYTISGTTVNGTKTTGSYPLSQNPPIAPAELSDTIDAWENNAVSGGVFPTSGRANKTISGTNNSLGPIKINGDLIVTNGAELRLTGNIWVNGNIVVSNNATIYLDSSFGDNSAIVIADYKDDRSDWTKGKITISNNATISGVDKNNPKTPSYILMFSTQSPKTPAEPSNWINYPAIDVENNVHGGVYYAPYGSFALSNVAQIRAVVANGLVLRNNATLDYDGNWGNSGISTGPAGKWTITEWLISE
jgi:hypothetical protein